MDVCGGGKRLRLELDFDIVKALFHWARKKDVIEDIPNIDVISSMASLSAFFYKA